MLVAAGDRAKVVDGDLCCCDRERCFAPVSLHTGLAEHFFVEGDVFFIILLGYDLTKMIYINKSDSTVNLNQICHSANYFAYNTRTPPNIFIPYYSFKHKVAYVKCAWYTSSVVGSFYDLYLF